jgi:hypothetical protein
VALKRHRCFVSDHEAGGKLSTGAISGFFRSVKNPTTTGMRIKISERQSIPIPYADGNTPELLTPLTSVEYGMLPVAVTTPNIHKKRPGQPQSTIAAIVAMRAVFLFVILLASKQAILNEYTIHASDLQGFHLSQGAN